MKATLTVELDVPNWYTHDDVVGAVQKATAMHSNRTGVTWIESETVVEGTEPPMAAPRGGVITRETANRIINESNPNIDAAITFGNMTDSEVMHEATLAINFKLDCAMADADDYDTDDKAAEFRSNAAKRCNKRNIEAMADRCYEAAIAEAAEAIRILEGN